MTDKMKRTTTFAPLITNETIRRMKQKYAVIVLFALIITSSLASLDSYRSTSRKINEDMDRALALALEEQQSDVINQDTIQMFNRHLQMTELRGKTTIAVDTHSRQFKVYAHCSKATIFSLSDQRPAALLWVLTGFWAMFLWYRRQKNAPAPLLAANNYGGLTYSEDEGRFYTADGTQIRLTPMQHQLMEMFFHSPSHSLSKTEICETLWPKKPDASDTLYTLIRRMKPVIEQHSDLKIEADRGRAYELKIK